MAEKFVVNTSVVDLREEPQDLLPKDYSHHPLRNTQVLFGERLQLIEEKGEWLKVAALEQPHFTEKKGWHFYEGWIKKSEAVLVSSFQTPTLVVSSSYVRIYPQNLNVLFGTYLCGDLMGNLILPNGEKATCAPKALRLIPNALNRKQLVQDAKLFLKLPYLWGGRSFHTKSTISSVDCSGLINLIYRAQGKTIPRDAHPQCLASKEVQHLQMGDLLYLSKETKMCHVILKIEGPYFLDSSGSDKQVRYLRWGQDIWEKNGKIHLKDFNNSYFPFYRSFINNLLDS